MPLQSVPKDFILELRERLGYDAEARVTAISAYPHEIRVERLALDDDGHPFVSTDGEKGFAICTDVIKVQRDDLMTR